MALNVRFPQANEGAPTLDILDENSVSLGAKPIRDVTGAALSAALISANVRAELYYVDEGNGYWILGAGGARGTPGPAGPPNGEFYIIADTTELGFRTTGGTPIHNFGQVAIPGSRHLRGRDGLQLPRRGGERDRRALLAPWA